MKFHNPMKYHNTMKYQKKAIYALALSLFMLFGSYGPVKAQDTSSDSETAPMESRSGMMKNCPMMSGEMTQGGQMQGSQMQGGMQGGMMSMMMQRMASDPARRSAMQVYMLPALQDALSLDEGQVASLKETKRQFSEQRAQMQEDLAAKKKQLQETLRADRPDLVRAETLLDERAALKSEAQMASVEAAAQMTGVLSAVQREKLAALKPMQMHRTMMKSMPMADMMQMMSAMEMSCPMMNGGMMNHNSGTMRMEDENQHGGDS